MTSYDFGVDTILTDTIAGQSQNCSSNHVLNTETRCALLGMCACATSSLSLLKPMEAHSQNTQHSIVSSCSSSHVLTARALCFLLGMHVCMSACKPVNAAGGTQST